MLLSKNIIRTGLLPTVLSRVNKFSSNSKTEASHISRVSLLASKPCVTSLVSISKTSVEPHNRSCLRAIYCSVNSLSDVDHLTRQQNLQLKNLIDSLYLFFNSFKEKKSDAFLLKHLITSLNCHFEQLNFHKADLYSSKDVVHHFQNSNAPLLLHVPNQKAPHYMMIIGIEGEYLKVLDPGPNDMNPKLYSHFDSNHQGLNTFLKTGVSSETLYQLQPIKKIDIWWNYLNKFYKRINEAGSDMPQFIFQMKV